MGITTLRTHKFQYLYFWPLFVLLLLLRNLNFTISICYSTYCLVAGKDCGVRTYYLEEADEELEFTSPFYIAFVRNTSIGYPNGVHCIWFFDASAEYSVVVRVHDFELEFQKDVLFIGNGYEAEKSGHIGRLTGTIKLQTIASQSRALWLHMVSDNTGRRKGFLFHITKVLQSEKGMLRQLFWNIPKEIIWKKRKRAVLCLFVFVLFLFLILFLFCFVLFCFVLFCCCCCFVLLCFVLFLLLFLFLFCFVLLLLLLFFVLFCFVLFCFLFCFVYCVTLWQRPPFWRSRVEGELLYLWILSLRLAQ